MARPFKKENVVDEQQIDEAPEPKPVKEWQLGAVATQTKPVVISPDGEMQYEVEEALVLILNKLDKIQKAVVG